MRKVTIRMLVPESTALGFLDARDAVVRDRLADVERRLGSVRSARSDWTDEEHDPEGFALTHEWSHASGARVEHLRELEELDAARRRLASGSYGICRRCGAAIPVAQLERRPARLECVACTDAASGALRR